MALDTVKRIAGRLLGAGVSRIRIGDAKRAKEALTAEDVRTLIKEGIVYKIAQKGTGRGKSRLREAKKRRTGGSRGQGSIRGTGSATMSDKKRWMQRIRALRRLLRSLKPTLADGSYGKLSRMLKGGVVRDKRQLREYAKNLTVKK